MVVLLLQSRSWESHGLAVEHHMPSNAIAHSRTESACWRVQPFIVMIVILQTLAYLLPILSLATRRAEEEFVSLKRARKAHEAGTLQVSLLTCLICLILFVLEDGHHQPSDAA